MWLRCDVCRHYGRLNLAGLHDLDYRAKTFSCSRCGAEAWRCVLEPSPPLANRVFMDTKLSSPSSSTGADHWKFPEGMVQWRDASRSG
jgi:hypothetical protein